MKRVSLAPPSRGAKAPRSSAAAVHQSGAVGSRAKPPPKPAKDHLSKSSAPSGHRVPDSEDEAQIPTGGDVTDCLDANEIDKILTILDVPFIRAERFYRMRTESNKDSRIQMAKALHNKLLEICKSSTDGTAILPVHVAHHWATSRVRLVEADRLVSRILDSAPHPGTARLYRALFKLLDVETDVICHLQQERGSNECGLHIFLIAIWNKLSPTTIDKLGHRTKEMEYFSLHPWRKILKQVLRSGKRPSARSLMKSLLDAKPELYELMKISRDVLQPGPKEVEIPAPSQPKPTPHPVCGGCGGKLKHLHELPECSKCKKKFHDHCLMTSQYLENDHEVCLDCLNSKRIRRLFKPKPVRQVAPSGSGPANADAAPDKSSAASQSSANEAESPVGPHPRPFVPFDTGSVEIRTVAIPRRRHGLGFDPHFSPYGVNAREEDLMVVPVPRQAIPNLPLKNKRMQALVDEFFSKCDSEGGRPSLDRAPKDLQSDKIYRSMHLAQAKRILEADQFTQEKYLFASDAQSRNSKDKRPLGPTEYLEMNTVDYLVKVMPELDAGDITVVDSITFKAFADTNSRAGLPQLGQAKGTIACVIRLTGGPHFLLAVCNKKELHVVDSLKHNAESVGDISKETLDRLGMFLYMCKLLWPDGTEITDQASFRSCKAQKAGDCGIETINNLYLYRFGIRGDLTREQLGEAWLHSNGPQPAVVPYPFRYAPLDGAPQERAPEPALPEAAKLPVPNKSCCKMVKIGPEGPAHCDKYCDRHHPYLPKDRPKCSALNKHGKPCGNYSIATAGVTKCLYHASEEEKERVVKALDDLAVKANEQYDKAKVRVNNPYDSVLPNKVFADLTQGMRLQDGDILVSDSKGPLPHITVQNFLRSLKPGAAVLIDMRHEGGINCQLRGLVSENKSEVSVTHRVCRLHGEWHKVEPETVQVPTLGVQYTTVALTTADLQDATAECDYMDEGSDLFDSDDVGNMNDLDGSLDDYTDANGESVTLREMRQCLKGTAAYPADVYRMRKARGWLIHQGGGVCPPTVHKIVWNRYTSKTRANHVKWLNIIAKKAPPELADMAIGKGIVELVMRTAQGKKWAWSTISTNLSAAASALRDLELYTNASHGIDIRNDPYFKAASETAQKNARVAALNPKKSAAMTKEECDAMCNVLRDTNSIHLLRLTWSLAARIGDVRRLRPSNIKIDLDNADSNPRPTCAIQATFVEGKGAYFWGPYTIHSRMEVTYAKPLQEYLASIDASAHAFAPIDQARIATECKTLPDHSVRSIRRGALQHMSNCGVSDRDLQLLSGHKRMDTLLRYLGWGAASSEATIAASKRAELEQKAAARSTDAPAGGSAPSRQCRVPMKMGRHSGHSGDEGRRVPAPPSLFSMRAPSRKDLGLKQALPVGFDESKPIEEWEFHEQCDPYDPRTWALKAFETGSVDFKKLAELVEDEELAEALKLAEEWINSSEHYGIDDWPEMVKKQVPISDFTSDDMIRLLRSKKAKPLGKRPIRCGVAGFAVPQPQKQPPQRRPVFETKFNPFINKKKLPFLKYPHRRERRRNMYGKKYFYQFDFHSWYDHIDLHEEVLPCYVLRIKEPIEWEGEMHDLFVLTKDPMGSAHAAHTAQTATWAIIEPLIKMKGLEVATMIDNIAIASDDKATFVKAFRELVSRAGKVGVKLNDQDKFPTSDEFIAELKKKHSEEEVTTITDNRIATEGEKNAADFTFLGERYIKGSGVCNTEHCVKKLEEAYERLKNAACEGSEVIATRRQICSIYSLAFWMANTLQLEIYDHFEMMRIHSEMARHGGWDQPCKVTKRILDAVHPLIGTLRANKPVVPTIPALPSFPSVLRGPGKVDADYDVIVVLDSCETGFGGVVRYPDGSVAQIKGGFSRTVPHSAHSEPLGATKIISHLREKLLPKYQKIAVVTDHTAMVDAQRRPISGNGGFSKSFYLNNFFKTLYSSFKDRADVFYVEGTKNIADYVSRTTSLGMPISVSHWDNTFPEDLSQFYHPFREPAPRKWWNV